MAPRIPPELLEHIMDLSTDLKTVCLCGLVSSEWIPRSRYILFSTVCLSGSNFRRFLELLGSPTCSFASSVYHLGFDAETSLQSAFYTLATSSAFGRLVHVHSLRLTNIDWTCFSVFEQAALESGLARLRHVTEIDLHSLSFHDLEGTLRVANSFPLLTHLRLIDVHFSKYLEYNLSSAKTQRIPPAWEVVEIDSGDAIPSFLRCICANLAVGPLGIRLLKLLHIDEEHHSYVEEAIRFIDVKQPGW
ncbi:hypothetical protein B0H19DRAFT_1142914 [Mycena capillaripes]|nr:hypothetical protein B0H19DRAFT_1142914 [Mycena capillaripes]